MRSWFPLLLLLHVGCPPPHLAHTVCDSKDIRNKVENLEKLENCTVIEGFLSILLVEAVVEDYHGVQYPKLVEVTDYVLFYRIKGLESIGQIFPNLAVIRGNRLFQNYALVVFEMYQLQEIALPSLTRIWRGGVRMEKNPRLCHVDTVNWGAVALEGEGVNFFKDNGETSCLHNCPPVEVCRPWDKEDTTTSCWNSTLCQKQCPPECSSCMDVEGQERPLCCHSECLGSCTGPTTANCTACRNFFYNGRCLSKCPSGTFMYLNWRCVTELECIEFGPRYKTTEGRCLPECPSGFTDKPGYPHLCQACSTHCPKVCLGERVESTAVIQKLKGCTIIQGSLEIHLRTGGSHVLQELQDSLLLLKEITGSLKVTRSILVTSLNFLPNLTTIHGNPAHVSDNYTLLLRDNPNLSSLWDWNSRTNTPLHIVRGLVMIEQNPRLCPVHVEKFWNKTKLPSGVTLPPPHVLELNGDMVACEVQDMEVGLYEVGSNHILVQWKKSTNYSPSRPLLGYLLYYRQFDWSGLKEISTEDLSYGYTLSKEEEKNISRFDSTCGTDLWKVVDIPLGEVTKEEFIIYPLTHLQPYTSYILYVRTDLGRQGAHSSLFVFRTAPTTPSPPRRLLTHPTSSTTAVISWLPPSNPNGRIHHYLVEGVKIWDTVLPGLDYCQEMPPPLHVEPTSHSSLEANPSSPADTKCCSCKEVPTLTVPFEDIIYDSFTKPMEDDYSLSWGSGYCRANNSASSFCQEMYHNTYIVATDLHHFTQYLTKVRACIVVNESIEDQVLCSPPAMITVRTLPKGGRDDVQRVWRKDNTTARVEWEPPTDPNGILLAYHIKYTSPNSNQEVVSCVPGDGEPLWKPPHSLGMGNFSLQLRAVSLAGPGNWSTPLYFNFSPPAAGQSRGVPAALPVIISVILLAGVAVVVLFFLRFKMDGKRGHGGILIASVNPEYMSSHLVYEPDEWEVDRDRVTLLQSLGQGSFGQVFAGELQMPDKPSVACAVKVAHVNQNHSEFAQLREKMDFLTEATVMKGFSCHHVVRLLGVVSRGQPTLVLMELMENGDLKSYLRACRSKPPSPKQLVVMAAQVADGMAYLASCKFVHRDLAARNCLVAADLTVKIGDFGMARDIYETDYYRRGQNREARLPVRWMAPESLRDGVFSSQSDVWSYGVVLWEMATLAAQPYQGLSNEEVVGAVLDGVVLEEVPDCPPLLSILMKQCWQWHSKKRPTFQELVEQLLPEVGPEFCQVSFCQVSQPTKLANGHIS